MSSSSRRRVIAGAFAVPLLHAFVANSGMVRAQSAAPALGPRRKFDFEWLKAAAQRIAGAPFAEAPLRAAALLDRIDYADHQKIRFRSERSLWAAGGGPYPIQFFHLGKFFRAPVRMHIVEKDEAREILYSPEFFSFDGRRWDGELPKDIGFAGFRIMAGAEQPDWLAFLGAAYFRSAGALDQYGLSARGIAIDTALPTPEEFPRFTQFWLAPVAGVPEAITIHALMDGPSMAGAFRMVAAKDKAVVMDIECALFARKDVARMGVAPLTSMFWYGKNSRHLAKDWRPQVHDSEGLAMWTGAGERIWRPLNNPPAVQTSSFRDSRPRGFGLLQRDRDFENFQDDGVFYEKRPSVWVEPLGDWGAGDVQLIEIPTDSEIHDNIVAYWVPRAPVAAGSRWDFRYRLHWSADEPYPSPLGRAVATWTGLGGLPGQTRPRDRRKIVVDFAGGPIEALPESARESVAFVVDATRGRVEGGFSHRVLGTKRWRVVFDVAADNREPVDLRGYLRLGDQPLTETWIWQYHPFES